MSSNKHRERDQHYAEPHDMLVDFVFDEKVASVFPDMIRRSVPGYDAIISQLSLFTRQFAQHHSRVYDLGCSTGASSLAMARGMQDLQDCQLIAVDNSEAMLRKAKENLHRFQDNQAVRTLQLICADIQDVQISNASVVCLNFTLQFIAKENRESLLRNIYQGLRDGGILILSEKLVFDQELEQAFQENMQLAFKRDNGYSELEIAQKRSALENVLHPENIDTHVSRLQDCGFEQVYTWFQNFNFASIAAVKI